MKNGGTRIILLPGLGSDARLLRPQAAAIPQLEVPRWLTPGPDESLASYGKRMAATVHTDQGESPYYLGGVSFGGMVALEMAQWLKPAGLFLIGSCRDSRAVAAYLRWLRKFADPLPDGALKLAGAMLSPSARLAEPVNGGQLAQLQEMFDEVGLAFIRWGAKVLMDWNGPDRFPATVHQIHGGKDLIIPPASVGADEIIPEGAHLINLTHPGEVNRFILERI